MFRAILVPTLGLLFVVGSAGQDNPEWKAPADAVTVTGKTLYKGNPPKRRPIETDADKHCKSIYSDDNPLESDEVIVKDGNLANVFVYVKNAPKFKYPIPNEPVVLSQKGCRYDPHVFGIQVKQKLIIKNGDATTHNVHKTPSSNPEFNKGQAPGSGDLEFTFTQSAYGAKAERIQCDIHGWMLSYMHVLKHPFFGVSGEDGKFTIKDLPPGEYEFEAWHEKFGLQTLKLKLPEDKGKLVFEFEKK